MRLETLVYRDRLRLDEAAQILRTLGETDLSDRELATLLAELPPRTPGRPVDIGPAPLVDAPASVRADERVVAAEVERQRRSAEEAMTRALERLAPEDQLLVRLRYWEDMGVAEIARALGLPQKPLYRRLERAVGELRVQLEAAGVSRDQARALLSEPAA